MRILPYKDANVSDKLPSKLHRRRGPVIITIPNIVTATMENLGIRIDTAAAFVASSSWILSILGIAANARKIIPPIQMEATNPWKKSIAIAKGWFVAAACDIRL
jgi:hypothetical protein